MEAGRVEQRSMHVPYWLWQASELPCAKAPDAAITSEEVSSRNAGFMVSPECRIAPGGNLRPRRAVCTQFMRGWLGGMVKRRSLSTARDKCCGDFANRSLNARRA